MGHDCSLHVQGCANDLHSQWHAIRGIIKCRGMAPHWRGAGTHSAEVRGHKMSPHSVCTLLFRQLMIPVFRYVDDFFGAGRSDVYWSGGKCMDSMMILFGFEVDHKKSVDDVESMVVLGHLVCLRDSDQSVARRVGESKAVRWGQALSWIPHTGFCPPATASKLVGRFSWTATSQADKVGRAYIRPWYMQQHDPTHGNKISE